MRRARPSEFSAVIEPDHYRILGVSPQAPKADIQAAYRRRLRESHPDRGGSADEFHLVQGAWEILSHPGLRREYDLLRFGRRAARRYQKTAAAHRKGGEQNVGAGAIVKIRKGLLERTPQLLAVIAALLGGRSRAWRKNEWAADLSLNPRPVRYALGLIRAAIRMRIDSGLRHTVRGICWVLASEGWTWTPLGGLLGWAAWEAAQSAGPGSAFLLVLTGPPTLLATVQGARKYFRVTMRSKPKGEQPDSDE